MTSGRSKVDVLKQVPLFAHVSKHDLKAIAETTDEIQIPPGRTLIREGDHASEFIVLVDGEVDVSRAGIKLDTLRSGSFFGETALLTHHPRNATVTTTTSSHLLIIRAPAFTALLQEVPSLGAPIAQAFAERVHLAEDAPY